MTEKKQTNKSKKTVIVAYNQMDYIRELYNTRQDLIDRLKDMMTVEKPVDIVEKILTTFAGIIEICEDLNDYAMKTRYLKELINFYDKITVRFHELVQNISRNKRYSAMKPKLDEKRETKKKVPFSTIEIFN